MKCFPTQHPTMQKYCPNCHRLQTLGDEFCECNVGLAQFIMVPIAPQLKTRLESKLLAKLILIYYNIFLDASVWDVLYNNSATIQKDTTTMRDIYDGQKYRELNEFTSKGNLTMLLNTDGVQLFKSSSMSMWPIWLVINELPFTMR